MRVVIQRVKQASVTIKNSKFSEIADGLLIFAGYEPDDSKADIEYLCQKTINLRVFDDEAGIMNKSILDINGDLLLVSQFTLHAATKKGNRPSYIRAAKPELAVPLYHQTISLFSELLGKQISTGEFGADMQVSLINNGPVTILMDSKQKDL